MTASGVRPGHQMGMRPDAGAADQAAKFSAPVATEVVPALVELEVAVPRLSPAVR